MREHRGRLRGSGERGTAEAGFVDSVDRATGKLVARIAAATDPADLPAYFERARATQKAWAARTVRERCVFLRRLGRVIFERRAEIVDSISGETGKPRAEATFAEILVVLDSMEFVAKRAPGGCARYAFRTIIS